MEHVDVERGTARAVAGVFTPVLARHSKSFSLVDVAGAAAPVPHTPASDLSGYHQIQLGFISVRDHFEPQWLKESLELLSGGKLLNKQIAGGS